MPLGKWIGYINSAKTFIYEFTFIPHKKVIPHASS